MHTKIYTIELQPSTLTEKIFSLLSTDLLLHNKQIRLAESSGQNGKPRWREKTPWGLSFLRHSDVIAIFCPTWMDRISRAPRIAGVHDRHCTWKVQCTRATYAALSDDGDDDVRGWRRCRSTIRAAATFVAQRLTLFSVHPENSTRSRGMVTHIWYLSTGDRYRLSPDTLCERDRKGRGTEREGRGERERKRTEDVVSASAFVPDENAKNLTTNSRSHLFLHL